MSLFFCIFNREICLSQDNRDNHDPHDGPDCLYCPVILKKTFDQ